MRGNARIISMTVLVSIVPSVLMAQVGPTTADASPKTSYKVWSSAPPADCPFPQSREIVGIGFTGRHAEYTDADTWYPSWAADGHLYSPWTDGRVHGIGSVSFGEKATTGHARIIGDDPLKLQVVDVAVYAASPAPYGGRYPCGSLVYNGIWYYGTYCLANEGGSIKPMVVLDSVEYNWAVLGPFVGFRISRDFGRTWTETPHTPSKPLFPEPASGGRASWTPPVAGETPTPRPTASEPASAEQFGKVKIGSPHFVDFGRNMVHSPDGKAYLVAHGAADPDPKPRRANLSWITGDQVYLIRVTPSPENMNDARKYEFFAGRDDRGQARWTRDFAKIEPLVEWNNRCGCVTMTYNAPLAKYLMCITDGWPTAKAFDTYVLESSRMEGPWRLVSYLARFGQQGYFVNLPSKFISADGRTAWLCYAANYNPGKGEARLKSDPPGSRYAMCLQEIRLPAPIDRALPDARGSVSDEHR